LDMAICVPADWRSVHRAPAAARDLVRAILAPRGQRGDMIFSYYNPQLESDETTEERFMRKSASYLLGETTPASPPETACAAYPKEPAVRYARYRHANTALLAKSWVADNGFAYAGLVF